MLQMALFIVFGISRFIYPKNEKKIISVKSIMIHFLISIMVFVEKDNNNDICWILPRL